MDSRGSVRPAVEVPAVGAVAGLNIRSSPVLCARNRAISSYVKHWRMEGAALISCVWMEERSISDQIPIRKIGSKAEQSQAQAS